MSRIRALTTGGAMALALTAAACGSSASNGSKPPAGSARSTSTVKALHAAGLNVLANTTGMAVYTPVQESSGKILCTATNGCTTFWKPVTVERGAPRPVANLGRLGVIKRPDGKLQLTDNSRPLYTFAQDTPGRVTGNGFKDAFGGQHFTWHVILSSGNQAGSHTRATSSGSGGGANGGGGGLTY